MADQDLPAAEALEIIACMHSQDSDQPGGLTSGCCVECDYEWPCPTAHLAKGWGEIHDCWEARWCQHAGVKLHPPDLVLCGRRLTAQFI